MAQPDNTSHTSDNAKRISWIAQGASLLLLATIATNIIGLIKRILISRTLGPTVYGTYSLFFTIANIVIILSSFSIPEAVHRFISDANPRYPSSTIILTALTICTAGGLLIGGLVTVSSPLLSSFVPPSILPLLPLIPLFTILYLFKGIFKDSMLGGGHFGTAAVFSVIPKLITILLIAIAVLRFSNLSSLVIATLIGFTATAVIGYRYIRQLNLIETAETSIKSAKAMLSYSWPLYLAGISALLLHPADALIIQYIAGASELGLYKAAEPVATTIMTMLGVIAPATLTAISQQETKEQQFQLYQKTTSSSLALIIPAATWLVFYPETPLVLFGSTFTEASTVLQLLVIGYGFRALSGPINQLYKGLKRTKYNLYGLLSIGITNIIATILLTSKYGIDGAAGGTLVSCIILYLYHLITAQRLTGNWIITTTHTTIIASAILAATIATIATTSLNVTTLLNGSVGLIITGAVYLTLLYATDTTKPLKNILTKDSRLQQYL